MTSRSMGAASGDDGGGGAGMAPIWHAAGAGQPGRRGLFAPGGSGEGRAMDRDETPRSVAEGLLATLAARGTRRIWGVPGGGSSLDLIAAGNRASASFVLPPRGRGRDDGGGRCGADRRAGRRADHQGTRLSNAAERREPARRWNARRCCWSRTASRRRRRPTSRTRCSTSAPTAAIVKGYARCEAMIPRPEITALLDAAMARRAARCIST
jgi:acetolactate synthase I/II/III large subunit